MVRNFLGPVLGDVSRKLAAAFVLVSLATIAVGAVGIKQVGTMQQRVQSIQNQGLLPALAVRGLGGDWFGYQYLTFAAVAPQISKIARDSAQAQVAGSLRTYLNHLAEAQKMRLTPKAAADLAQLATITAEFRTLGAELTGPSVAKLSRADLGAAVGRISALNTEIPALITTAAADQAQGAAVQVANAGKAHADARAAIFAFLGLGVVLSMVLAFVTARSVTRPMKRTVLVLDKVAAGDLTARVQVRGTDQIAAMGTALNVSLDAIGKVFRLVTDTSHELSSASNDLAGVSADIVSSVDRSAERASEIARSADEVSANVGTVASGTDEMALSISEISVSASEATAVAAEAMTVVAQTTATISKLGDSSAEIGTAVKAITSIAEQTNLLALNATIEAARAGEAGKGFAVVASEVKDLAQETARATEDIGARVAAIQADTAGAVEAIGRISEVIERVHGFQSTIAAAVREQNATTSEMGRNVAQAAASSADIASGIAAVAEATTGSTAGAHTARSAAAELAEMSTRLKESIGQFTA